jgi:hypothetical protein
MKREGGRNGRNSGRKEERKAKEGREAGGALVTHQ